MYLRTLRDTTGRVWRGTAFGGARVRRDVPKIVDWCMEGKIKIDPLITHTLPFERINEAFNLMHYRTSSRTVVTFEGGQRPWRRFVSNAVYLEPPPTAGKRHKTNHTQQRHVRGRARGATKIARTS